MHTIQHAAARAAAAGLLALILCGQVLAQAASGDDILIGASLPLSGPDAAVGQETLAVAKATFDAVNAAGGIHGRRISLVALDDQFQPARAAENARKLEAQGAVALFNCWGTANCTALLPVSAQARLPVVSGIGIADVGPQGAAARYAFNVRPTTEDEIARMVRQMDTIGQRRIAVAYQDDAFGKSGQAAAQRVLARAELKAAGEFAMARDASNMPAVVEALRRSDAQGVVVVAPPLTAVALVRQARQAGLAAQFYCLAAQAHRAMVAELGEHTTGVVFTTLVPSPWNAGIPIVRDYQQALRGSSGRQDYSYLGLEVYINARVLVEGLRKAGPKVTRESLVTGLETMGEKLFTPTLSVRYGPGSRNGSSYVGLTMISRSGNFIE